MTAWAETVTEPRDPQADTPSTPRAGALAALTPGRVLAAIIVLGAALRFATLGTQSLWADEGFTAKIAGHSLASAVSQVPHTESTPPVYYALAWIWAHLFGTSAFVLRSLSALFGTATVWAVYWAGVALSTRRVALRGGTDHRGQPDHGVVLAGSPGLRADAAAGRARPRVLHPGAGRAAAAVADRLGGVLGRRPGHPLFRRVPAGGRGRVAPGLPARPARPARCPGHSGGRGRGADPAGAVPEGARAAAVDLGVHGPRPAQGDCAVVPGRDHVDAADPSRWGGGAGGPGGRSGGGAGAPRATRRAPGRPPAGRGWRSSASASRW